MECGVALLPPLSTVGTGLCSAQVSGDRLIPLMGPGGDFSLDLVTGPRAWLLGPEGQVLSCIRKPLPPPKQARHWERQ